MADEITPEAWVRIKDLARELAVDHDLADSFEQDPIPVLSARRVDLAFPAETGYRSLGDLLARLDPVTRMATLQSIGELSDELAAAPRREKPETVAAVVTAVVNVNVVANANAAANANVAANANARANTNVSTNGGEVPPRTSQRVAVFEGFAETPAAARLSALQLSSARQLTLLKRVALDDQSVVESRRIGDSEFRLSRYTFRDQAFEVQSLLAGNEVQILDVRLV